MGCPSFIILGKLSHNYGKLPFLMGKSTISMAMFNSYVTNYQRVYPINIPLNHYKIPLDHYKISFILGKFQDVIKT
jgi:hypothetical protein